MPTCELARTPKLTPQSRTRNLGVRDGPLRPGPEVIVAGRRFLASLLLWTSLLGIVQPAFACASQADCCQGGATGGCGGQPHPAISPAGTDNCCAVSDNTPTTASIPARPDQSQPHSSSAPVAADLTPAQIRSDARGSTPLPRPIRHTVFDQSLTYLRTARLRL